MSSGLVRMQEVSLSGIDIIHCDSFMQYDAHCGDVMITDDRLHGLSYILSAKRGTKNVRVLTLENNSNNIRYIPFYGKKRKKS